MSVANRALTPALLSLAACGGGPMIELAECAGGEPIGTEAVHSLELPADGRLFIDGVVPEGTTAATLERLMRTMRNNEEKAASTGWPFVIEEPLLVRIDAAATFGAAAYWLTRVDENHLYVTWLAVQDSASGAERCLVVEREPPRGCVNVAYNPDWAKNLGPPQVGIAFAAVEREDEAWELDQWTPRGEHLTFSMRSWREVNEKLESTPEQDRHFRIRAQLPKSARWSDIVPILAQAQSRWSARIGIYGDGEP